MTKYLVPLITLVVGCFSVDVPATFRCSNEDPACPAGQVCNGSTCVPEGSNLDGAVDRGDLALTDIPTHDQGKSDQGSKTFSVSIFAGTGSAGTADGPVATAQFNEPVGLFGDGQGAVYVADSGNHCIRKIENNAVTTVAGKCGTAGVLNGAALTIARFRNPTGIIIGSGGGIVVADSVNHCIRLIQNGQVSTVAGKCGLGLGGYQDGTGTDAEFRLPFAVMFNGAGDVVVADSGNNCLRLIKQGTVSTLAGYCNTLLPGTKDGAPFVARFNGPSGIWWDKTGNRLVIGDSGNNCIRELDATQVKTIAGVCDNKTSGYKDGPTGIALFQRPTGIVVGTDGIYISDTDNHSLRRMNSTTVSTLAGNGVAGSGLGPSPETKAVFNTPSGVLALGADRVLVADSKNHRILLVAAQ